MTLTTWKSKRLCRKVLTALRPEFERIARSAQREGRILADDRFLLGYLCIRIGIEIRRSTRYAVPAEIQGRVLLTAMNQLFGRAAPAPGALRVLLKNDPSDPKFTSGAHAAFAGTSLTNGKPPHRKGFARIGTASN